MFKTVGLQNYNVTCVFQYLFFVLTDKTSQATITFKIKPKGN